MSGSRSGGAGGGGDGRTAYVVGSVKASFRARYTLNGTREKGQDGVSIRVGFGVEVIAGDGALATDRTIPLLPVPKTMQSPARC